MENKKNKKPVYIVAAVCVLIFLGGIGGSINYAEMLINTEFGIAMGNACPEVKQIADVITEDCDHSGVGKAVERYLLHR